MKFFDTITHRSIIFIIIFFGLICLGLFSSNTNFSAFLSQIQTLSNRHHLINNNCLSKIRINISSMNLIMILMVLDLLLTIINLLEKFFF